MDFYQWLDSLDDNDLDDDDYKLEYQDMLEHSEPNYPDGYELHLVFPTVKVGVMYIPGDFCPLRLVAVGDLIAAGKEFIPEEIRIWHLYTNKVDVIELKMAFPYLLFDSGEIQQLQMFLESASSNTTPSYGIV